MVYEDTEADYSAFDDHSVREGDVLQQEAKQLVSLQRDSSGRDIGADAEPAEALVQEPQPHVPSEEWSSITLVNTTCANEVL